MNCAACGQKVPDSSRHCPGCQNDCGFPNVRAADRPDEQAALRSRVDIAEVSSRARNCESNLKDFGKAVLNSKAVFCRNLSSVVNLVSSDSALYSTFYKQIEGEIRLPEDNRIDQSRVAVDGMMFPNYAKHVCFAALSLSGLGPTAWGPYSIELKENMTELRSSTFEENSVLFCQTKHHLTVGDPVPPGFRASWHRRGDLAMAKLHARIDLKTASDQYHEILLSNGSAILADFIEVHIWGPIHRSAIERVVGPKPKSREDKVLWKSLKAKLEDMGSKLEST